MYQLYLLRLNVYMYAALYDYAYTPTRYNHSTFLFVHITWALGTLLFKDIGPKGPFRKSLNNHLFELETQNPLATPYQDCKTLCNPAQLHTIHNPPESPCEFT